MISNIQRRRAIARFARASLMVSGWIGVGPVGILSARAADLPKVIRIGAPALGGSGEQVFAGTLGVARKKGWLDDEFAKDGIHFEFPGYRGGAPMVGQALANHQIDFAWQGDLLSIIGRSAGMQTHLILPFSKMLNAYLAAPLDSTIHDMGDLRGKRVAYFKGNQIHLQVLRILAANGLSVNDIRSVSLDGATALTALASGDVDAAFGGPELLAARDRGIAKIVYDTHGKPTQTSYNGLVASDAFIDKYPQVSQRLINVLVRAAAYASDPANRAEVTPILAGFYSWKDFGEDYGDRPWTDRLSPLLDPFLVQHYEQTEKEIKTLGLLRGPSFDVKKWIEPRFVDAAIEQLRLRNLWQPLDVHGERMSGSKTS